MNERLGTLIGNYKITEQIGRGAFSEVYLAKHVLLTNRNVAIKFLHSALGATEREQFIREAYVLEQLKHPHILPIYDVGFYNNHTYLITEYAFGGSLKDYIERSIRERVQLSDGMMEKSELVENGIVRFKSISTALTLFSC